jgi:hypothetical protein
MLDFLSTRCGMNRQKIRNSWGYGPLEASATTSSVDPRSQPKNSWLGQPILLALGGTLLVVASVLFWFGGARPILDWFASLRWVEVPCKIDSASVVVDHKTEAIAFLPEVRYRYKWNDQTFHGTRFAWDTASYSSRESIEKWIEPFPAGKETVCYVNPRVPEESVLLRAFPKPTVFVNCVMFFFISVGLEIVGTLFCSLLPPWKNAPPSGF